MSDPEAHRSERLEAALEAFKQFAGPGTARARADFEAICAKHPELTVELRALRSVYQLAQAAASSRSFQEALREEFGELSELTVELEEGSVLPPPGEGDGKGGTAAETPPGEGRRYSIEGEVGHGGMGVVWRVRDQDLSRTLAMKVMAAEPGRASVRDPTSRINLARFIEEAQVTAQLDHPGIVPVHEIGFDARGRPFFTMKMVKGRNLDEIFDLARKEEEGWNLPRVVGVLVKACQALAYAHQKGVIHRDLKPANIMVGRFGEVYLMDWGLAKITGRKDLHDIRLRDAQATEALHSPRRDSTGATADSPLITMDGSVVGTPSYMPPEQARGQVEEVDRASDIYSFGAILYHLLTGRAPYFEPGARISPHTILARVLDGPPRRVHLLNQGASPELIAICEKAMAREKRERYASSLHLAEDLQAFLDHRVVRAYRTGAVAELRSWVARNRTTAVVAAASVLLVMGLFFSGAVWERAKAFKLRESLTRQYLRRGQTLCEQGDLARGLHWLARSLEEAPEESSALRGAIQQNLAGWSREWQAPRAIIVQDSLINSVALSPDGKRVVTNNHNGVTEFWSAETGEPLGIKAGLEGKIFQYLAFSPDGRQLLNLAGQTIYLCDAETGDRRGPELEVQSLTGVPRFSPDGRRLAARASNGTVSIWDTRTGEPLGAPMAHQKAVNSVAFSPDGRKLLTASDDQTARLWNVETGESLGPTLFHPNRVLVAVLSPDGERIATACGDDTVRLWGTSSGQQLAAPMTHQGVQFLAFSQSGPQLLSGGGTAARLWNAATGDPLGAPMLHEDTVTTIAFSVDGRQVLTGSADGIVRVWSSETGESLAAPYRHGEPINWIYPSPDGRTVLAGVRSHFSGLWSIQPSDLRSAASVPSLEGNSVAFAPDGRRLLVGNRQGQTWWWSAESAEAAPSRIRHDRDLWCVAISPDGKRALTGSADRTARLWDIEGGERPVMTLVHEGDVRAAVFSADGKLIATASFDRTARIWSADTGRQLGPPLDHPNMAEDVTFSPDGGLVATACGDGAARLWSVKTGRQVGPAMAHRGSVLAVKFSPDGRVLVTGSRDRTSRFWTVATGLPTGMALDHPDWVEDVCFSRDGKRLATASERGGIRIWSVETGEKLGPPLEQSTRAWQVAFSPDGTLLAGSSDFAPVRLWTLTQPFPIELRHAERWVEVLTWQEMDRNDVLRWLDRGTWLARRAEIENLTSRPAR